LTPIAIGWVVFALILGSAMLAMALHSVVPEHHLSTDSKDVVKLGIAVIATMSALVLSLLIASAKGSYDTRSREFTQMSANIILLDRLLAHYGPETKDGAICFTARSSMHWIEAGLPTISSSRYWRRRQPPRKVSMTESNNFRRKTKLSARCKAKL
jgi:hypothetical protein